MERVKDNKLVTAFPERAGSVPLDPCFSGDLEFEHAKRTSKAEGSFFISRKRSKEDFVLMRVLDLSSYSILHYVEIEGKVQQIEFRFIRNAYELELMKRTRKLCSEGLYVELEPVSLEEYRRFERVGRRGLREVWVSRRDRVFSI